MDDLQIVAEGGRQAPRIIPVQAAEHAGIHQAFMHPGSDVQLRTGEHIAHQVGRGPVHGGQQDLQLQALVQQRRRRHDVGTGGAGALESDAVAFQVRQ